MATENLTLVDKMSPTLKFISRELARAEQTFRMVQKASEQFGQTLRNSTQTASNSVLNMNRKLEFSLRSVQKEFKRTMGLYNDYKNISPAHVKGVYTGFKGSGVAAYNYMVSRQQAAFESLQAEAQNFINGPGFRLPSRSLPFYRYFMNPGGHSIFSHENINNFTSGLRNAGLSILGFTTAIGIATDSIKRMIKPQEEYIGNLTRIALTSDMRRTPQAMANRVYDVAVQTRADAEGSMMLYNRIAMSGVKESNDNILRFVETFNKLTALSGTSGQENRAVMLQLAQGIGSNRLGGDEFRSIAEQAPLFKYMLAKGMGVGPGELKKMGAEGKLTARAILDAMSKVQDEVDSIFKNAPWKIEQLFTIMKVRWDQMGINNLQGYTAVRDLVKDIAFWLTQTQEGQIFMKNVWDIINRIVTKVVSLIRQLRAPMLWVANHIKLIADTSAVLMKIWLASKIPAILRTILIMSRFINIQWIRLNRQSVLLGTKGVSAITMMTSATKGLATAVKSVGVAIGNYLAILLLAWEAGKAISDWIENKKEADIDKKAYKQVKQSWIDNEAVRLGWGHLNKKGQFVLDAHGSNARIVGYENWRKQAEADYERDNPQAKSIEKHRTNMAAYDPQNAALKELQGMLASDKNKEMSVKGGYLDGIKDSISIDNEGIEMMKTIADRQWVMQNEVVVPQQVTVTIDKSVNMDEQVISDVVLEGVKRAVGGSLTAMSGGF